MALLRTPMGLWYILPMFWKALGWDLGTRREISTPHICLHYVFMCFNCIFIYFIFYVPVFYFQMLATTSLKKNIYIVIIIVRGNFSQISLIARFMGPTWGPSEADRTQVGPMLAPCSLLSGLSYNGRQTLLSYLTSYYCATQKWINEWMKDR